MDLSNISEEATERENVANVQTPLLEISLQDGTAIIIRGHVNRGDEVGVPIYADFRDSAGDPIDPGSTLALQYEAPSIDEPQVVGDFMAQYSWVHCRKLGPIPVPYRPGFLGMVMLGLLISADDLASHAWGVVCPSMAWCGASGSFPGSSSCGRCSVRTFSLSLFSGDIVS